MRLLQKVELHSFTFVFGPGLNNSILTIFFKDFIYLLMTQRERRQREKQAPRREPDMGLDPGSPGSCPGPKIALNH